MLAVLVGSLTGAPVGAANGAVVAWVGVTPFIVTLGTLSMARCRIVLTHGDSVRAIRSRSSCGPLECSWDSVPVIVLVLACRRFARDLDLHRFRPRLAVGGNEEATELSGINTRRIKFSPT